MLEPAHTVPPLEGNDAPFHRLDQADGKGDDRQHPDRQLNPHRWMESNFDRRHTGHDDVTYHQNDDVRRKVVRVV
nr:hypothetical protein [Sphingobium sp. SCG-1]